MAIRLELPRYKHVLNMKKLLIIIGIFGARLMVSYVSKKKYTELESNIFKTQTELAKTSQEKLNWKRK